MLEVTPIVNNGRAETQLRNGGKSAIAINILIWPEGRQRPAIRQLLSDQLHLSPNMTKSVDITVAVLAMTGAHAGENVAVWMVFEVDPDCQRFPVRYELNISQGRVTRFVEQYPLSRLDIY